MLPLPLRLNTAMAGPLQSLATLGSVTLLQATGLPVISEGNVIIVGGERLEVARACNGLSMLLSFATLVTAMVVLVDRPPRQRVALLLSIVPVALLCNVLRIAATAWATHLAGHAVEAVARLGRPGDDADGPGLDVARTPHPVLGVRRGRGLT